VSRDAGTHIITKGVDIGRTFRFLRRSKALRQVPATTTYATHNILALIPAVDGQWALEKIRPTEFRTGWAKICRLLEAYSVVQKETEVSTFPELSLAVDEKVSTPFQCHKPSRVL
jgi:hypothetical protein